jgi:arylsulfatase A
MGYPRMKHPCSHERERVDLGPVPLAHPPSPERYGETSARGYIENAARPRLGSARPLLSAASPKWMVALLFCSLVLAAPAADRPNIILMMADDMGMGDTSAYQDFTGNDDDVQLRTPAMERLARMGVRFVDAHTPASRCTPTRYGLLTGRYPWRSRMKWWVLYGAQGDPLIEADRPTIASMLGDAGYSTAMVGKWHVGLRYRRSDGSPAAGWNDADLTQPLHTTPLDYGFGFARFTSRSHGTSGPDAGNERGRKRNAPKQNIGPGHVHGRKAIGATGEGKRLTEEGPNAYVLTRLGCRHSDHALAFMEGHVTGEESRTRPFFLYYPANSNHGPYTPDSCIDGEPVAGAARTKAGEPMDARHDYIYENDVALDRLLDWLSKTDDPRSPGKKLADNTLVIFTSDNGAEKNSDIATGPFRSHKGSCYEGGHRVPFIAAWPAGGVGDGDVATKGRTDDTPIGLQDLYATFSEIVGVALPDLAAGEKGAEDSVSVLPALRGGPLGPRPPLFFSDHKEARGDPAVLAMRLDSPTVGGRVVEGQWKVLFDAGLAREGKARPFELYNLAADPWEKTNLVARAELGALTAFLSEQALLHRTVGGHRLVPIAAAHRIMPLALARRIMFDWRSGPGETNELAEASAGKPASALVVSESMMPPQPEVTMTISGVRGESKLTDATFSPNPRGLGLGSGTFKQVDDGEALLIRFDCDVIVEYAAIVAGNGQCGGFYRVGASAPLAIYCVDADNDSKEQHGILSDIGVLRAGEAFRLDSRPYLGVEPPGRWRLGALSVRVLER